jgi:nitroreductase
MELRQIFEKRRSVNFFDTQKTISEDLIKNIYDVAKLVPSSFNLQPWKFILVRQPENKKKLRAAALNQPKVEEAQATLILLADKEGYKEIDRILDDNIAKGYIPADKKSLYAGMTEKLYGSPLASRGFALRNAGLFAMGFMLAAKDFGVDTHPMDGFDQDKVKQAFNIPERYEVAMLIAVGYHDDKKTLLPRLNRKNIEDVVIREGF